MPAGIRCKKVRILMFGCRRYKLLREIHVSQSVEDGLTKRWFAHEDIDLFIWMDESGNLVSYQMSFDKNYAQKALAWDVMQGFSTLGVDEGARPGKHPGSPLLIDKPDICVDQAFSLFVENSSDLEPTIRENIIAGISEFLSQG